MALPDGCCQEDVPVVFLHGVGLGIMPYLHMMRVIQKALPHNRLMVIEVPHVALRPCSRASRFDEVAAAVKDMVLKSGAQKCCLVAHSYGTFVASRVVQLYPDIVHSTCLLDPVSMMTCYPQLLANFVYRSWVFPRCLDDVVDLVRFACSRDLLISETFCRLFHWTEIMLWPHDLPAKSLVVVAGADDLVPAELVMAQLKMAGHPAKVLYHEDLGHGGFLMDFEFQNQIINQLQQLMAVEPEAPVAARGSKGKTVTFG